MIDEIVRRTIVLEEHGPRRIGFHACPGSEMVAACTKAHQALFLLSGTGRGRKLAGGGRHARCPRTCLKGAKSQAHVVAAKNATGSPARHRSGLRPLPWQSRGEARWGPAPARARDCNAP